jgi:RNA polymerase sigma-70 factor (ECF subfamily)
MSGVERIAMPAAKAGTQRMAGGAAHWDDDGKERSKTARFKALALPHLDEVYTLARYLLRNANDADDAVQDCYLRAFRHFDTFRGGPIKPWLLAILRNVCHATYAGKARLVYTADQAQEQAEPVWREADDTPEQAILRQHSTDTMRRLIGELPDEFKEVIVLREINDLSYREIATVIESPIGTVMSRLARGRKLLREAWIACEGEGEAK